MRHRLAGRPPRLLDDSRAPLNGLGPRQVCGKPAEFLRFRPDAAEAPPPHHFFAMWDVLKWQNDTLSVAWWALLLFAFLILVAAGSHAARK